MSLFLTSPIFVSMSDEVQSGIKLNIELNALGSAEDRPAALAQTLSAFFGDALAKKRDIDCIIISSVETGETKPGLKGSLINVIGGIITANIPFSVGIDSGTGQVVKEMSTFDTSTPEAFNWQEALEKV